MRAPLTENLNRIHCFRHSPARTRQLIKIKVHRNSFGRFPRRVGFCSLLLLDPEPVVPLPVLDPDAVFPRSSRVALTHTSHLPPSHIPPSLVHSLHHNFRIIPSLKLNTHSPKHEDHRHDQAHCSSLFDCPSRLKVLKEDFI